MRSRHLILLGLLGGFLLTIAWPGTGGLVVPVFFGLVPFLFIEHALYHKRELYSSKRIFRIVFPGFFLWNVGVCFFIWYIREPEATPLSLFFTRLISTGMTYGLNTIFMATVFWLFHLTRRRLGDVPGYVGLLLYWLAFEYLHMHWSINWPWLNLGNVFCDSVWMVQWYEYFGSAGGTLWVLLVNLFFFSLIKEWRSEGLKFGIRRAISALLIIVVPIMWSSYRFSTYEEVGEPVEVVCVQPNLDPYEEKFKGDPVQQITRMIELMDSAETENTRFFLLPETAMQERATLFRNQNGELVFRGLWEGNYNNTRSVIRLQRFIMQRPRAVVISGAADRELYERKETASTRYYKELDIYYDSYNSTLQIDENGVQDFYRKSKLVPGTESIPFSKFLSFLEKWSLEIGGASGSLGTQEGRQPFDHDGLKVAPNICYESVFGEFTSLFVKNGAQALFVSSNDAWWQSSPGHIQLMLYCKLRAIETRKNIARSANTGISCFVDQRGKIKSQSEWLDETAIRDTIYFNDTKTFYVKHGDFISRVAAMFSCLLILWSLVKPIGQRK